MKKAMTLCAAVVLASALNACTASKPYGSLEAMGGHESSRVDFRVGDTLSDRSTVLARGIVDTDYDNEVSSFALVNVAYTLADSKDYGGLSVSAEAQALPEGVVPRLGFSYLKLGEDHSIYALATAGYTNDKPDGEFILEAQYRPNLTDRLKAFFGIEAVTNFGGAGLNWASQGVRLGIQYGRFIFGGAVNINETSSDDDLEVDVNAGAFIKIELGD